MKQSWPQLFDPLMRTIIGRQPAIAAKLPDEPLVVILVPATEASRFHATISDADLIPWARDLVAQHPADLRQHPGADAVIAIASAI